jgi:hypothetical protein
MKQSKMIKISFPKRMMERNTKMRLKRKVDMLDIIWVEERMFITPFIKF